MSEEDFEKFKQADFCNDDDLLSLTIEQMEEVANTDARVRAYGSDQKEAYRRRVYAIKKHQQS